MTDIKGAVVLVTGGGRGLGKALVADALDRGASKVYATARDPRTIETTGAVPLQLEVTDPASVAALAEQTRDVTVLINNAGVAHAGESYLADDVEHVRRTFETNFFGPLLVTQAVVPQIIANGGGHVVNVASVLSWIALGGPYSASKAALWSMTDALRLELLNQKVSVTGLYVGYMDTDMTAGIDAAKSDVVDVARQTLDGVEAGAFEVLADELSRQVRSGLSSDLTALYPQLGA